MAKIVLRKKWVSTDPWRGYYEYENSAFGGCILAGDKFHNEAEKEKIEEAKKRLRKAKIPFRFKTARTSNVFSIVYDIVVSKRDLPRAKRMLKDLA